MKSEVIFTNSHYTACAMKDGSLIVTRSKTQTGKRVVGPQASEWIQHIRTALDTSEAAALCKGILA